MIKKRPVNHNDWVKDNARWRTHLADTFVENTQSYSFDKNKGHFVDSFGDRVKPEKVLEEQKQLSKLVNDLSPKDHNWNPNTKQYEPKNLKGFYYNPVTQEMEPRNNPSPHISSTELKEPKPALMGDPTPEPKIHTPAYRKKYPERYGHKYTSKLDQAAYPKAGTAPSEKIVSKSNSWDEYVKTGKLPKGDKALSTHDIIYKSMSPIKRGQFNARVRKVMPNTAKLAKNFGPKIFETPETKIELVQESLLHNLEALQQDKINMEQRAEKFRRDMQPQYIDDDFSRGVGSLLGVTRKDFK